MSVCGVTVEGVLLSVLMLLGSGSESRSRSVCLSLVTMLPLGRTGGAETAVEESTRDDSGWQAVMDAGQNRSSSSWFWVLEHKKKGGG